MRISEPSSATFIKLRIVFVQFWIMPFIQIWMICCMTRYIEEEDLMRFMIKEEVDLVFPLFEGAETGYIDRKALTNWVVRHLISHFVLIIRNKAML